MGHGSGKVIAAVGGHAGHHQAHGVLGVDGEGLVQHGQGLAFQVTAGFSGQQVGIVHQQIGVGVDQLTGFDEGGLGLRQAPHDFVGARQHCPANGVVRVGLEFGGQLFDHFQHFFLADLLCGLRVNALGRAQPAVHGSRP